MGVCGSNLACGEGKRRNEFTPVDRAITPSVQVLRRTSDQDENQIHNKLNLIPNQKQLPNQLEVPKSSLPPSASDAATIPLATPIHQLTPEQWQQIFPPQPRHFQFLFHPSSIHFPPASPDFLPSKCHASHLIHATLQSSSPLDLEKLHSELLMKLHLDEKEWRISGFKYGYVGSICPFFTIVKVPSNVEEEEEKGEEEKKGESTVPKLDPIGPYELLVVPVSSYLIDHEPAPYPKSQFVDLNWFEICSALNEDPFVGTQEMGKYRMETQEEEEDEDEKEDGEKSDGRKGKLMRQLVSGLKNKGFVRIRIPNETPLPYAKISSNSVPLSVISPSPLSSSPLISLLSSLTPSASSFFRLPQSRLSHYTHRLANKKFVGYSNQGPRSFYQVRMTDKSMPYIGKDEGKKEREMRESMKEKEKEKEKNGENEEKKMMENGTSEAAVVMPSESDDESQRASIRASFLGSYAVLNHMSRLLLQLLCSDPSLHLPDWNTMQQYLDPTLSSTDALDSVPRHAEGLVNTNVNSTNEEKSISDPVLSSSSSPYVSGLSCGASVYRVYQYYRPPASSRPGLTHAATGLHADMGLLTVSPQTEIPGLTILDPSAARWWNVERESQSERESLIGVSGGNSDVSLDSPLLGTPTSNYTFDPIDKSIYVYVFVGETMARMTHGRLRSAIHFVDETEMGKPRYSFPFFLRPKQDTILDEWKEEGQGENRGEGKGVGKILQRRKTVRAFMEQEVLSRRVWTYRGFQQGATAVDLEKEGEALSDY